MREQDRLGQMLVEWAEWKRKSLAAGYSGLSFEAKAMLCAGGEGDGTPAIWKLWADPQVRRIEKAIEALRPDNRELMEFTQAFYISGPGPLVSIGWTYKDINHNIAAAHKLIRKEMRLRG